jgi:hypothetical protein
MRARPIIALVALTALSMAGIAVHADEKPAGDIKQLKGIAIVGDKEAPKALYIVPWHNAEHQQNTRLSTRLTDNTMQALDRDTLLQQLQLYELSKSGWYRITADEP